MTPRRAYLLLALVSALCIFPQLGLRGLNEPDEGRIASISYEMLANHNLLTPRLYDHGHFNKPPLAYWTIILCFWLGGVTEWTARMPAALSAIGIVLLTAGMSRRLLGERRILLTGLILLTALSCLR